MTDATPTIFYDARKPGTRIGNFVLREAIGQGGEGIVYRAEHDSFGAVAVKEYLPKQIVSRGRSADVRVSNSNWQAAFDKGKRNFLKKGRELAALHPHQNLVHFLEVIEAHKTAFLVMRFVEGESLSTLLAGRDFNRPEQVSRLAGELAAGLQHLHEEGKLHRDIAPDNIIISNRRKNAVLIDFNTAKDFVFEATRSAEALVKPGYSPIEQYSGEERDCRPASDIYAASAVLYHAITGAAPADATRRAAGAEIEILSESRPRGYAPGLLKAIDAGLAFRIENRPPDVECWREIMALQSQSVIDRDNVDHNDGRKNSLASLVKFAALAIGFPILAFGLSKCGGQSEPFDEAEEVVTEETVETLSPDRLKFDELTKDLQLLPSEMWLERVEGHSSNKNMKLFTDDYVRLNIKFFRMDGSEHKTSWAETKDTVASEFPLGPEAFKELTYGEKARFYIDAGHLRKNNSTSYPVMAEKLNLVDGTLIYAEVKVEPCIPASTPKPMNGNLRVPCMEGTWETDYSEGFSPENDFVGVLKVSDRKIVYTESWTEYGVRTTANWECKIYYIKDINVSCTFASSSDEESYSSQKFELKYMDAFYLRGVGSYFDSSGKIGSSTTTVVMTRK